MMQFEANNNAEIERVEISLSRLRKEFAQYREQFDRAYDNVQSLLACRESRYSNPSEAELYERTIKSALQEYFQLRGQIDWWLEQARQIVARRDN